MRNQPEYDAGDYEEENNQKALAPQSTQYDPQSVQDMHRQSDVDSSTLSQHHSLGYRGTQASPGDHTHNGGSSKLITDTTAIAAIAGVLGKWTDITPGSGTGGLWLANSGTAPAIGSGKLWAKYLKIGTTVWYKLGVTAGTGTTFGTDFWKFPLPFTAVVPPGSSNIQTASLGAVLGQQGGVNNYTGVASLINSTNLILSSHLNANPWGPTVPFTWTASSGNFFGFTTVYESTT